MNVVSVRRGAWTVGEKKHLVNLNIELWSPVRAVPAFPRCPEVLGQAKLELAHRLAGGHHSLNVEHPWAAPE